MQKKDYQQYADPNCPTCEGNGYVWDEDLRNPDDNGGGEYIEWCECALRNYLKSKKDE